MADEDNEKKAIEIATAFCDGYHHGKIATCQLVFSWLLEHSASYSENPNDYDPLSMVVALGDFLNNQVKDGRTSGVSV